MASVLCASRRMKCRTFQGHDIFHSLFHFASPPLSKFPASWDIPFACAPLVSDSARFNLYACLTENTPLGSKCHAKRSTVPSLNGIGRINLASSSQNVSLTNSISHLPVVGSMSLETLVKRLPPRGVMTRLDQALVSMGHPKCECYAHPLQAR